MRILTTIVTLTIITFLASFNPRMKVNFIYIKRELDIAKIIKMIKVFSYTDSTMAYGTINSNDTLIIKSKRGRFLNLTEAEKINEDRDLEQELGGKWPGIGQTILMVIDTTNSVRHFAFRVGSDYRFWDPNSIPYANSVFFIPKEKPFKQLPVCLQITDDKSDYWTCTDGCLIDATAIKKEN